MWIFDNLLSSYLSYLSGAASVLALYLIGGAIYRLYLSPVSAFPGPKLAALTFWYSPVVLSSQARQLTMYTGMSSITMSFCGASTPSKSGACTRSTGR